MVNLRDINSKAEDLLPDEVMGMLKYMLKGSEKKPEFIVDYTVVKKTEDYEERRYPASTWVCTTVTGVYQDTAKIEGFRHLQTYAQGHNSASARLTMHPPMLTRVSSEGSSGFDRKFVVSTYLCPDQSDGHPEPCSEHVYLEHLPEMTVFVRHFQGIACEEKWTYETKRLAEVLRNKEDVRTDFYITATYESPFQLVSSRNEIWFVKFDRREEAERKDTSVLKYGSQKVEIPDVFRWILQAFMLYLTVVMFLLKTTFGCSGMIKDNWDPIKLRTRLAADVVRHNLSLKGAVRTATCVGWSIWSLALALISGVAASSDTRLTRRKPIKN